MKITFERLALENFKNHTSLDIEFKDLTTIIGRNGAGKSSIGEAITWCLYGVDTMGNKLDPSPIDSNVEETTAKLLLRIDGKDVLLGRTLKKSKASYHINDVPEKATPFNELVESLFDKVLFLSMFNPVYFSTLHWQEQRSMLLQFIPEPLNKEVLAEMPKVQADRIEGLLKQHTLDDLEKIHRESYKKNDKVSERAAERLLTLQEQLEGLDGTESDIDKEAIQKEIDAIVKKRDALDDERLEQQKKANERTRLDSQIENMKHQIERQKQTVTAIKNEEIAESCTTCGQPLDEESLTKVKENRQARFNKEVQTGKEMVTELKTLLEKLKGLPVIEIPNAGEHPAKKLDDQIYSLKAKLDNAGRIEKLKADIEAAEESKKVILKDSGTSQGIIESIKSFRSEQADLMVKKVDDLFSTISVRLFEQQKNGEFKDTFEIEMDGKPYSKLSTAEKIKAGLEVIEVLSQQSEITSPTFLDNAESILSFKSPSGQLIMARVMDSDFQIKTESFRKEKELV